VKNYGAIDLTRQDVRTMTVRSVDLRAETGGHQEDATCLVEPGIFTLSLFAGEDPPVAEIRFMFRGRELSLVGAATGRSGVNEITPDLLGDEAYLAAIKGWLARK